jgi:TonB family protein
MESSSTITTDQISNLGFRKNLIWSVIGHVSVLGLIALVASSSVQKPIPQPSWIDLAAFNPGPPQSSNPKQLNPPSNEQSKPPPPTVKEPQPNPPPPEKSADPEPAKDPILPQKDPVPPPQVKSEPPKQPVKEPIKPAKDPIPPKKEVKPPPTPKPPKQTKPPPAEPKVKLSDRKITRNAVSSSKVETPAKPSDSTDAHAPSFAEKLNEKLKKSSALVTAKGGTGTGSSLNENPNEFAAYYHHIFEEMYGAWQPPFGLDEGLVCQILIRVEKNGIISKVSLARTSGNKLMDESSLTAANAVKKLQPPPEDLGQEITVNFRKQTQ